jgi:hypothetical protein
MSFTDLLRGARSSRVATVHKFLTNYDPNSDRIYAFVEGDADEAFYRAQIQKYTSDERKVYTYNCEGKTGVVEAYENIVTKYPECQRVLFFLDKDVDDIVGVQWPTDPRIFVTECYSIENYVINKQAISRYFKDYVKIRRVDVDIEIVLEQFEKDLAQFHQMMIPLMAWIIIMKRAGCRVVLNDVDPGELFMVTDDGNRRKPKRRSIAYLTKVTQVRSPSPTWKSIRTTCSELRRLPSKAYIRGKFEAWWFVEFCRRVVDGLQRVVKEANGSIRVHAQLNSNTFIQLLAAGIETPARLNAFLTFHTKPGGMATTEDLGAEAKGLLRRIASLFKIQGA